MKGPQDIRREKEYNLVADKTHRTGGDEFDNNAKYVRQIDTLKEENHFLHNLSNRLQTELKEYQIRFPQSLVEDNNNNNETEMCNKMDTANNSTEAIIPPWLSSSKYMSPLLIAYDAQIKELQTQIKTYQKNALHIKQESSALMKRNQALENELETKIISLHKKLKIQNQNRIGIDAHHDLDCNNNESQQRIKILSQQNALLRESEMRFESEQQNYVRIISENKENIHLLQTELSKMNAINREFEQISKNLECENRELTQINKEFKNNVIKKLNEKTQFLEQRLRSETSENQSLKKRMETCQSEYNSSNDIQRRLEHRVTLLTNENAQLINRLNSVNDDIIAHKNELSLNRKKMKTMNASLDSVDNVLQMYKNKEIQYMKSINDLKCNNELFMNVERDKLIHKSEQCLQQIKRLKTENLTLLKERQTEIKTINDALEAKYTNKFRELNATIDDLMTKNVRLSEEKNEFENKCDIIKTEIESVKEIYLNKFETLKSTENELNCKVKELDLESERCLQLVQRRETDSMQETHVWKSEKEILKKTISELSQTEDRKNLHLIQNQETIARLNERVHKITQKLKLNNSENSANLTAVTDKLTENESLFNSTIQNYKNELSNLENLYTESQIKTKDIISKHEQLSTKWKEENRNSFENFTKIMNELKRENKALRSSNVLLQTTIESIEHKQQNIGSEKENIRQRMMNAEKSMHSLNESIANLKSLNHKYQNKETLLLSENKNLRNELNKTQISMQRLQRNHQFNRKINIH